MLWTSCYLLKSALDSCEEKCKLQDSLEKHNELFGDVLRSGLLDGGLHEICVREVFPGNDELCREFGKTVSCALKSRKRKKIVMVQR